MEEVVGGRPIGRSAHEGCAETLEDGAPACGVVAMSTQPLDIDRWSATGVDLETRRRRILAVLAAMGRSEEQQQFRRTLAKRTQAALATENYGLLERYIQGWYLHVIALQTRPGWAAEWDQLRRNGPTVADPDAAEPLEDILARLRW
jgi:hypothetical protein